MKQSRLKYVVAIFCILLSITKTNAQWSELGGNNKSSFYRAIYCIAADAGNNIYTAGSFINSSGWNYLSKWGGSAWKEVSDNYPMPFS